MQIETQAPPAPPAIAPPPIPTSIRIEGGPGGAAQTISIPLSEADVRWLRARRSELSDQLSRASNRREDVVEELATATGASRVGLEQRLTTVDQRIAQLESDIAETERVLTGAPSGFLAAAEPQESSSGVPEDVIAIPVVFTMFVLFPLAIAFARRIWKRTPAAKSLPENSARLERIEQAVEAIAVEVERVSEGQRFVTKLLSDTHKVPLSLPAERHPPPATR